jgi:4-diphosphocytidyl-2-C-methyl-D-erythritol kinase
MTRSARVRALAKINLDLRVLGKRPDGYHEIRTVFQTISLADTLDLSWSSSRRTAVTLETALDIPDNLVERAAHLCLDAMKVVGRLDMTLRKQIPIGAGLGGGSSDAAAVLLALPVLAGRPLSLDQLLPIAHDLGSDVPFFLLGGTVVGLGRGGELYPLLDGPPRLGVIAAPSIHVSTAEAYQSLRKRPRLTSEVLQNKIDSFQSHWWEGSGGVGQNDFEPSVFARFPKIASVKRKLGRLGAEPVMMSGSGSSVFGFFRTREEVSRALESFPDGVARAIRLVTRKRYHSMWRRSLRPYAMEKAWPPQDRQHWQPDEVR